MAFSRDTLPAEEEMGAPRPDRRLISLIRKLLLAGAILLALPIPIATIFRFLPPPATPLMVIRLVQGEGLHKEWTGLPRISPWLVRAVIASEDSRFCQHHGFDWVETRDAVDEYRAGGKLRGASTISMQTAKNLFLWPGRSFLRKGVEAYLTVILEGLWPKSRILETYLNIAEWGHGIYGAETAAETYFHKPALDLDRREAALLAAVLPNPRLLSAAHPSAYVEERVAIIEARLPEVEIPNGRECH